MSLFGNVGGSTQQQSSNLFNPSATGTGTQNSPFSLGGTLGASSNPSQPQPQTTSLFGAAQPAQSGGLFGMSQQPQNQGGLVGSLTQPQHIGGGLFGGLGASTAQQQPSFGSSILGSQQLKFGSAPIWQQSNTMDPSKHAGSQPSGKTNISNALVSRGEDGHRTDAHSG